ncbi:PrsW family glutamic-type intramembrane protease [Mycoplasmatota bacterium WC30]
MEFSKICPKCKCENSDLASTCQNCGHVFYITKDQFYEEDQFLTSHYKVEKSNLFGLMVDDTIKSYWKCFKTLISRVFDFKRIKDRRLRNNELKNQLFEPKLSRIKYPYYYMKTLLILIFVFALSVLLENVPITYLTLSLIIPFVLMWFLFELTKNLIQISGMDLLKAFVVGGFASVGFAVLVYSYIDIEDYNFWVFLLFAFIEESSKLILCIIFIRKIRGLNIISAILIGFSIGAGFNFLETARYALFEYSNMIISIDSLMEVFLRTVYGFFGIGHHYWTGILSGALVFFAYDNVAIQKRISVLDIFKKKFIFWVIIFVNVHALFNYYESILLRVVLGVISLFVFYRFYISALCSRKISCAPVVGMENK